MDNNYPPYVFLDANGILQGILVDQWRLWQQKTGIQVEIKAMEWASALKGMKAGEFDVIDTIFKTEERSSWLDFCPPYARIEVPAFFNYEINSINDVHSLNGFVVAVKEGDAAIDLLRSHGITNLVFFTEYEAIIQAAKEHKVNVFVIDKPPALYFLYKYGMQQQYKASPPLNVGEFHRAVKKGNISLIHEIEAGFAQISAKEIQQIETKWHGSPILSAPPAKYFLLGIGALCILILVLFSWNRSLKKAVKRRTRELETSEEELRESESRYRGIIENIQDTFYRTDARGTLIFMNPSGVASLGYNSVQEIIGRPSASFWQHPEKRQEMLEILKRDGIVRDYEVVLVRKDGTPVTVSTTTSYYHDKDGHVLGVEGIIRDITERKQAVEALRANDERTILFFERQIVGMAITSPEKGWLQVNDKLCQMLGFPREELFRQTWPELTHPDDLATDLAQFNRLLSGEINDYSLEKRFIRKDGAVIYTHLSVGCVRRPDGSTEYILSLVADITERKVAEETIVRERILSDNIINALPGIFYMYNDQGQLVRWNKKHEEVTGYSPEELHGKYVLDFFTEEYKNYLASRIQAVFSEGESDAEAPFLIKDGRQIPYFFTGRMATLDGQEYLLGVGTDITYRKQAEEELLAERQHLIDIIDFLPDATLVIDTEGQVVAWNRAAEAMTGVTRDTLLGKGNYAYAVPFYGVPRPILIDLLQLTEHEITTSYSHVRRSGEKIFAEIFIQALNNGRSAYLLGVAAPLYDRYGNRTGAIEVIRDVTELKQAEKEKMHLQEQLTQAQKMESIGRLAGGVAHDFNNMLGVILGYAELAQKKLDPEQPLFRNLEEIRKAAQRSADITQQLLAFARKQTVSPKILDLNETVEGMLKMLRRLIGEDIQLNWLPENELWSVCIDPSQIDQILANLCLNARGAITDVGDITIATGNCDFSEKYCAEHPDFLPGEYVRLTVSDNGCGMEEEILTHIFEPFFTTKAVGEGTGLGLATVYGTVKQNNGFIQVDSKPDQGTTFTIFLPRHAAKVGQVSTETPDEPGAQGNKMVLLVEDEPAILQMIMLMLDSQGYSVLSASTPGEALRLAREHAGDIHLLMTDVVMPEMNGRDLAKNLLPLYPDMKRLFMSGYTADVIAHHGVLDAGVSFLQKPFSINQLAAKIRETLEG